MCNVFVSFSMLVVFQFSFVYVCVRSFLYVVIACMCAMLKAEGRFWTEFSIDMDDRMHTLFDAR